MPRPWTVCTVCSCLVDDPDTHTAWHALTDPPADPPPEES